MTKGFTWMDTSSFFNSCSTSWRGEGPSASKAGHRSTPSMATSPVYEPAHCPHVATKGGGVGWGGVVWRGVVWSGVAWGGVAWGAWM